MELHSDYLRDMFNMGTRETIIDKIVDDLSCKKFDIIAVRGVSGLLFAMTIALRMNKGIVVVRKLQESSHSCFKYEGNIPDLWKAKSIGTAEQLLKQRSAVAWDGGSNYGYDNCGKCQVFNPKHQ